VLQVKTQTHIYNCWVISRLVVILTLTLTLTLTLILTLILTIYYMRFSARHDGLANYEAK